MSYHKHGGLHFIRIGRLYIQWSWSRRQRVVMPWESVR